VPQWVGVAGGGQRLIVWASFGGRRRPNRVRLREIGRMVDVRPSWWAAEIGGGRRRCLVVAGCGGGWRGSLGERGREHLWEGENEEKPKMKRNLI
jgi:hypothetical protein